MNTSSKFFILALNTDHDETLLLQANIITAHEVQGCYEGERETAYIVSGDQIEDVKSLAHATGQDSFALVENGVLYYYDRGDEFKIPHFVGLWQKTTKAIAQSLDGYTFDPLTSEYYAAF